MPAIHLCNTHRLQGNISRRCLSSTSRMGWKFTSENHTWVKINSGRPHGSVSKESAYNAGDLGSIPRLGRSPGEGNGYPLQYSCLRNPMDRGAWWATVHGVARAGHNWVTKPPDKVELRIKCSKEKQPQSHFILTKELSKFNIIGMQLYGKNKNAKYGIKIIWNGSTYWQKHGGYEPTINGIVYSHNPTWKQTKDTNQLHI